MFEFVKVTNKTMLFLFSGHGVVDFKQAFDSKWQQSFLQVLMNF